MTPVGWRPDPQGDLGPLDLEFAAAILRQGTHPKLCPGPNSPEVIVAKKLDRLRRKIMSERYGTD